MPWDASCRFPEPETQALSARNLLPDSPCLLPLPGLMPDASLPGTFLASYLAQVERNPRIIEEKPLPIPQIRARLRKQCARTLEPGP